MSAAFKISKELQEIADELAHRLDEVAGTPVAWSLFVWTEGHANYIANAERTNIISVLKEIIAKWEAGTPDAPFHEKM